LVRSRKVRDKINRFRAKTTYDSPNIRVEAQWPHYPGTGAGVGRATQCLYYRAAGVIRNVGLLLTSMYSSILPTGQISIFNNANQLILPSAVILLLLFWHVRLFKQ